MTVTQTQPFQLLVYLLLFLPCVGCDWTNHPKASGSSNSSKVAAQETTHIGDLKPASLGRPLSDKPSPPFQVELLDIAFETATSIPVHPHIKDRSKAQQAIVTTCLELDMPQRALSYCEKIDNWRRGAGIADVAQYAAQKAETLEVHQYLKSAADIASAPGIEDWRKEIVRVKIACAYAWLGHMEKAYEFEAGASPSQVGKVARVLAMRSEDQDFSKVVTHIDQLAASPSFEIVRNAMDAYTELFRRFFKDENRQLLIEERIRKSWKLLPVFMQIDVLMGLADAALENQGKAKALEFLNDVQKIVDGHTWPLDHGIPMRARLAGLRFRAGDMVKGRTGIDTERALFEKVVKSMETFERAEPLRQIAAVYVVMGDKKTALEVYRRALEEGAVNPNARPRAEDLAATCRSLAATGVEPDDAMWLRLRAIRGGLGAPW